MDVLVTQTNCISGDSEASVVGFSTNRSIRSLSSSTFTLKRLFYSRNFFFLDQCLFFPPMVPFSVLTAFDDRSAKDTNATP